MEHATSSLQRPPTFRELCRQLSADRRTHSRDWTRPGFRAIATYRFGVWAGGLHPPPLRTIAGRVYLALHRYVRNHYTIELHRTAEVGRGVKIAHQGGIVIHRLATIGDECVIRQNVTIGAANEETVSAAPVLGRRVDIGAGAVIIGKVTVGDGAHIGPNTVVTTDVPPGVTVFGNPMRILPATKVAASAAPPRAATQTTS